MNTYILDMDNLLSRSVGPRDARFRKVATLLLPIGGVASTPSMAAGHLEFSYVTQAILCISGLYIIGVAVQGVDTYVPGWILLLAGYAGCFVVHLDVDLWPLGIALALACFTLITGWTRRGPINNALGIDSRYVRDLGGGA